MKTKNLTIYLMAALISALAAGPAPAADYTHIWICQATGTNSPDTNAAPLQSRHSPTVKSLTNTFTASAPLLSFGICLPFIARRAAIPTPILKPFVQPKTLNYHAGLDTILEKSLSGVAD